ncbi:DUF2964 family protein [Streptomyces sp. NPDC007095]|uniref:DUF2964 family protein n=1 Tax=Streptomyces sp. NPDC007095 TaxID=3154482 RepID=UPI0033E79F4A
MREQQQRVIVLAKACAVVGIAFALHGTIADRDATFRVGMITLIVSVAAAFQLTLRINTQALMAHQTHVARLTVQERQAYAEMGYKAARLDALNEIAPEATGDAQIVNLPFARSSSETRKKGSAS